MVVLSFQVPKSLEGEELVPQYASVMEAWSLGAEAHTKGEKRELWRNGMTKGSRLHENWVPSTDDVAYGRSLGLSEQAINGCAEDMRLWAGANANRAVARKLDWSKAFKGWLRRTAARQPWLK